MDAELRRRLAWTSRGLIKRLRCAPLGWALLRFGPGSCFGWYPDHWHEASPALALARHCCLFLAREWTTIESSGRLLAKGEMDLRTERGKDNLSEELLTAAETLVARLNRSQYSRLYRLASNARQRIMGSSHEWRPFEGLLLECHIDRRDRNHVTALMIALIPRVLKQERPARLAAAREARHRMRKTYVREALGHRAEKLAVSTASSSSIEKGAERFPLALDRLAKK